MSLVTRLSMRQWTFISLAIVDVRSIRLPFSPLSTFPCRRRACTGDASILIHSVMCLWDGRSQVSLNARTYRIRIISINLDGANEMRVGKGRHLLFENHVTK